MSSAAPDNSNLFTDLPMAKIVGSGSGTVVAPAATSSNSPQTNTITIPNVYGTDDIIVACTATFKYGSLATQRTQAPWISSDGRKSFDCAWTSDYIYIRATSYTAGGNETATTFTYTYNVIML